MNFEALTEQIKKENCAGFRFQQAGHHHFRDRVTVYRDGRLLFERFCYGEAAGIVFEVWAQSADSEGRPAWDFTGCNVTSAPEQVPHQLTGVQGEDLLFDGRTIAWECTEKLKNDKKHGYGGIGYAFRRMTGKI